MTNTALPSPDGLDMSDDETRRQFHVAVYDAVNGLNTREIRALAVQHGAFGGWGTTKSGAKINLADTLIRAAGWQRVRLSGPNTAWVRAVSAPADYCEGRSGFRAYDGEVNPGTRIIRCCTCKAEMGTEWDLSGRGYGVGSIPLHEAPASSPETSPEGG